MEDSCDDTTLPWLSNMKIEVLYTSETFDRLQEDETGLYYQSSGYVYSFLQNELTKARVA